MLAVIIIWFYRDGNSMFLPYNNKYLVLLIRDVWFFLLSTYNWLWMSSENILFLPVY